LTFHLFFAKHLANPLRIPPPQEIADQLQGGDMQIDYDQVGYACAYASITYVPFCLPKLPSYWISVLYLLVLRYLLAGIVISHLGKPP
jgi:hypothetical protein